jgi:hypothetical protein
MSDEKTNASTTDAIIALLASWEETRATCAERVHPKLNEIASAAGVEKSDKEFAEKIVDAISGCIIQHRQRVLKRPSEIRKELVEVYQAATAAAEAVQRLSLALGNLSLEIRIILGGKWGSNGNDRISELSRDSHRFDGLAKLSETFSKIAEDKGGPSKYAAFRVLIKGLEEAFQHGHGRPAKVTRKIDSDHYEGDFIRLVNAVLPFAIRLAEADGAPRLERPKDSGITSRALGKYLERMTSSL